MTKNHRAFVTAAAISGVMLSIAAAIVGLGLRVNLTHSQPIGLYVRTAAPITHGTLVSACLDEQAPAVTLAIVRHYFPSGPCPGGVAPSLKNVAATEGDGVEFTPDAIVVNGMPIANTARLAKDRLGMSLPAPKAGLQVVPPGQVLLLATHSPLSFDGRYYGFMPSAGIQSSMRAVVTSRQ